MLDHEVPSACSKVIAIEIVATVLVICAAEQIDSLFVHDALVACPRGIFSPCRQHSLPFEAWKTVVVRAVIAFRFLLRCSLRSWSNERLCLDLSKLYTIDIVLLGPIKAAYYEEEGI